MSQGVQRIGSYTPAELQGQVQALVHRSRSAGRREAEALLGEARQLLALIERELWQDHGALEAGRAAAMTEQARVHAYYEQRDQAREAYQAMEVNQLRARLEQARQERSKKGLWERLTTEDRQGKQLTAELKQTEQKHEQQDQQDLHARTVAAQSVLAATRPLEQEVDGTRKILEQARWLVQELGDRASGWGEGSEVFRHLDTLVQFARRAGALDLDAKAYMALTAALTGRGIDQVNELDRQMRSRNSSLGMDRVTDVEALAVLACAAAASNRPPEGILELWRAAMAHARRDGGFSSDEDARAMVVFCAAFSGRNVEHVQSERRAINVENFRGHDPEGAGMVLLTHTLTRTPIAALADAYHQAARAGLPQEECGYMAMASGLGAKPASWVVTRYRGLTEAVSRGVTSLPYGSQDRRDAVREAAATLTIAGSMSDWRDDQLVTLFNRTESFQGSKPDFESRGVLVIGAVSAARKA
ncbi:MAG: hypothetical protein MUF64_00630 [Polyangiaceae bacterium]|jgi:hypothetical protein|nr:hypothetical protein [Polyangiaceae bacterium]